MNRFQLETELRQFLVWLKENNESLSYNSIDELLVVYLGQLNKKEYGV